MPRFGPLLALLIVAAGCPANPERPEPPPAVIFVHGLGASAAEMGTPGGQFDGLLPALADRFPRPGVCQRAAQPDRS